MKKKIGLIVNPIAGMGGSVGLKGTDGALYEKALELGALPVTPARTKDVFAHVAHKDKIELFTAPGEMGFDHVREDFDSLETVGDVSIRSTAETTKRVAVEMEQRGVELIVFVGGDGTARDIYDAIGLRIPVVAVPSGVKVFSAVFSYSARAAAELIDAFLEGADTVEEEVLDIDEEAFRNNRLASKLYGSLRVPFVKQYLQGGKECSSSNGTAAERKKEIASYIVRTMEKGVLYLLGPGTTLKAVSDAAGIGKTLLGVDACVNQRLVGEDVNEKGILELFKTYGKRKIIVTPIGGNGFIFGRGSKQFTPEVLRKVGKENILVAAEPEKLNKLDALRLDTGDYELDQALSGYIQVIIGDRDFVKIEVKC
jgi:predicted polyphosphate/ATP-dependent NAD kinase